MGAISPIHVLFVLIVGLIVIGPKRLPETGAALGKALREFREAANGITADERPETTSTQVSPTTTDATITSAPPPSPGDAGPTPPAA